MKNALWPQLGFRIIFIVQALCIASSSLAYNSGIDWDADFRDNEKTACILQLLGDSGKIRSNLELERRVSLTPVIPAQVMKRLLESFSAKSANVHPIEIAPLGYVDAAGNILPGSGPQLSYQSHARARIDLAVGSARYAWVRHLREYSNYFDSPNKELAARNIAYRYKQWSIPGETSPRVTGHCLKRTRPKNLTAVDRSDFVEREETFRIGDGYQLGFRFFEEILAATAPSGLYPMSRPLDILTDVYADRLGADLVWRPTGQKIGYLIVDAFSETPLPTDIATRPTQINWMEPIVYQYEIELLPEAIATYSAHKRKFKTFLAAIDALTGGRVTTTPKYLHF